MGQVTSSVGLMSGIPIASTISQLMSIAQQPVKDLTTQNTTLQSEQTAYDTLAASLIAMGATTDNLGQASLFNQQTASSSDSSALSATVTGNPAVGTYTYTPLQMAQAVQYVSNGFASETSALGGGSISFKYGPGVQQPASLSSLNGGTGWSPGSIRITDMSGASSTINLSGAQTIQDVLSDINSNTSINVTAEAYGNGIRLIDNTGGSGSLKVQDVSGGKTAESLGLGGINTSATAGPVATGASIVYLTDSTQLANLNDGAGVRISQTMPDITFTLSDGSTGTIDLATTPSGSTTAQPDTTVGQVLDAINAAGKIGGVQKLSAAISANGSGIVLTDNTSGTGAPMTLSSVYDSDAVADLGLSGTAVGGVLTGGAIVGGTDTVLLSRLNGGNGLGQLGTISLTDRSGKTATVSLASDQTLQDVINSINGAGVGITAAVNQAGNGIELTDTTGSTTSNMIVANGSDGLNTATTLNIAVNAATTSVNSGDLDVQTVSDNTLLSSLNGGAGVAQGTFSITDTAGNTAQLNLAGTAIQTVGDLINAINNLPIKVHAELNSTGDGIQIQDTAHGSGTLLVTEGSSTTAADLGLLSPYSTQTINGTPTEVIDGSTTKTLTLSPTDSLGSLVTEINNLNAGVTASIFNDGSSTPYRLVLNGANQGSAAQMTIDTSQTGISLQQTAQAQDALLETGTSTSGVPGIVVASSNNQFTNVLPGATLQIQQASTQPVTINVTASDTNLSAAVQAMVSDYNTYQSQFTTDTAYNTTTNSGAVLTDDPVSQEVNDQISNLMTGQFNVSGSINSLAQIGVTMNTDGTLSFDSSTLDSVFQSNPTDLQTFFTDSTNGMSAQFHQVVNYLTNAQASLLTNRVNALNTQITDNNSQITLLNSELNAQEEMLYAQYDNMDSTIGTLKSDLSVIQTMANIAPLSFTSSPATSTANSASSSTSTVGNFSSTG